MDSLEQLETTFDRIVEEIKIAGSLFCMKRRWRNTVSF
jgi:hypothetical protein